MRGKKKRKGAGEGKGHEKRKSPKTLTGTVRVALPGWLCHPPHCSHLFHTSHLTLHTSHLHYCTTTTTTTTNTARPPGCSGTGASHPWPAPLSPANLRGLRGWCSLLLARACTGRTRTSQPPRCTATLNRARKRIFLWLAWWGSHVSIGTGPVHRGLPPPCSSGSRNGTLLLLSVHTTSDRTSGSDWRCKIPTAALGTLADELRKWCLGLELRSICLVAGSKCRSMACKSISIPPPLVRPRADGQACKFTVSKHNTGRGGTARYRDRGDQDKIARNSGPGPLIMADG